MRFDSFQFAVFFPIVVTIFWCTPNRWRWLVLLVSSYYFYMCWRAPYALLLVLITAIDFVVGISLARTSRPKARRAILLASLASNLGILFVFKYYLFVAHTLEGTTGSRLFPELGLVLPIGLSFHTFQSMGYAIDVYHRKAEPERHWGRFATFIVFFPQLVAGPIERANEMLPQLRVFKNFDYHRVTNGLKLMAWGLFKKVVIADRLARLVDPVYSSPHLYSGMTLAVATLAFGYQIYCDFSGYTDIALGSAEVMGIRLRPNFRAPYHSRDLGEFWTRWHMSLSTWFRDYVYIPLGGNRVSPARWAFNILVVFGLSGLWHGANWTFVAWGLYHGVLLIAGRFMHPIWDILYRTTATEGRRRLLTAVDIGRTFLLVSAGWILFRASDIESATFMFRRIVVDWPSFLTPERFLSEMRVNGWEMWDTAVIALALLALEIGDTVGLRFSLRQWLAQRPVAVRWCGYYLLVAAILFCGQFGGPPFIYFQF